MYLKIREPVKWRKTRMFLKGLVSLFLLLVGISFLEDYPLFGVIVLALFVVFWIGALFIERKLSSGPIVALDFQPMQLVVISKDEVPCVLNYEQFSLEVFLEVDSVPGHKHRRIVFISQMEINLRMQTTGEMLQIIHQPSLPLFWPRGTVAGSKDLFRLLPYWESFASRNFQIQLAHPLHYAEQEATDKLQHEVKRRLRQRGKGTPYNFLQTGFYLLLGVLMIGVIGATTSLNWKVLAIFYAVFALSCWGRALYINNQERKIAQDFIRQDSLFSK